MKQPRWAVQLFSRLQRRQLTAPSLVRRGGPGPNSTDSSGGFAHSPGPVGGVWPEPTVSTTTLHPPDLHFPGISQVSEVSSTHLSTHLFVLQQ